jgi:hypothetical protein
MLEITGGSGVVDGDQYIARMRRGYQRFDVANVELRIGRRFDPQEARAVEHSLLRVVACRCQARLNADGREPARREQARRVIRIRGQHHDVLRFQYRAEHGRRRRHSRREGHRLSLVENAQRFFPRRPGRVVEAPVRVAMIRGSTGRRERRGELRSGKEGTRLLVVRISGVQYFSIAVH